MVNASLNWASIVGIALAICGAGLYFLRSFKPALARDYDVFFAAIGLLCGGILFFQGWRLDPILQFGQFLLAGTTVFFAYESVRLRGVTTDQARRSSFFDEDRENVRMPGGGSGARGNWDDNYDQFENSQSVRRRFSGRENIEDDSSADDFYRPRRISRAAIPEEAASRRIPSRSNEGSRNIDFEKSQRISRFTSDQQEPERGIDFGERRSARQAQRRGSRPLANQQTSRRGMDKKPQSGISAQGGYRSSARTARPKGSQIPSNAEDAAFSPTPKRSSSRNQQERPSKTIQTPYRTDQSSSGTPSRKSSRPRDNSSRFDD